ncbi:hypothetical protein HK405_003449 [Cladochytrium tenue]|nr:hypothetical protein HK405_003449 [Cladochytrium tenue]
MEAQPQPPSMLPPPSPIPPPAQPDAPPPLVRVRSTLPLLPHAPIPVDSARLRLRPLCWADLDAIRRLRAEHNVMRWTARGTIDPDEAATRAWLRRYVVADDDQEPPLPSDAGSKIEERPLQQPPPPTPQPPSSYNFAAVLLSNEDKGGSGSGCADDDNDENRGKLLAGVIGCHSVAGSMGWPEVGYMLAQEYWGRGLATEALVAFLAGWAALPRVEIELLVDARTLEPAPAAVIGAGHDHVDTLKAETGDSPSNRDDVANSPPWVDEQLVALIDAANSASRRVLEKCGFEQFAAWGFEEDGGGVGGGEDFSRPHALHAFRLFPGRLTLPAGSVAGAVVSG